MFSLLRASAVLAAALACVPAHAQSLEPAPRGAFGVQYGMDGDLHRLTLNYETAPVWSYRLGGTRIDLVGEFGISHWRLRDAGDNRSRLWQASAIPMFQWWLTERFFIEAGIGATVFNHTSIGEDQLSTAFQFGDHIGAAYQITDNVRLGLRVSHFSNAGIKRPNDGVNSYQAGLTMRF